MLCDWLSACTIRRFIKPACLRRYSLADLQQRTKELTNRRAPRLLLTEIGARKKCLHGPLTNIARTTATNEACPRSRSGCTPRNLTSAVQQARACAFGLRAPSSKSIPRRPLSYLRNSKIARVNTSASLAIMQSETSPRATPNWCAKSCRTGTLPTRTWPLGTGWR